MTHNAIEFTKSFVIRSVFGKLSDRSVAIVWVRTAIPDPTALHVVAMIVQKTLWRLSNFELSVGM